MLVVEVDHVDAKPPQAGVTAGFHVLRSPVDAKEAPVGAAHIAELGGDDDMLAIARQTAPDELFVAADPVHVGGVEERDAQLDGAVDGSDRFVVVAPAIELRHPHAPQP